MQAGQKPPHWALLVQTQAGPPSAKGWQRRPEGELAGFPQSESEPQALLLGQMPPSQALQLPSTQ
jgi:hypothetical protein